MRVVPAVSPRVVPRVRARVRVPVATGLLALLALASGCASNTNARPAASPPASSQRTVAVLPLAGGADAEGLGFAIAELLARDLALVPRVRVVERARLDAIQKEIGLGTSGRIAPASAPRAGQLVGADQLLTGNVSRTGANASIDVSLLNVSTGQTEPVFAERLPLNGIIDAQERLAEQAFSRLGVTLTPAERERLAKRPTRRVDALIAFGNGRRAERLGDRAGAQRFFSEASRLDPQFKEAVDATRDVIATGPTPTTTGGARAGSGSAAPAPTVNAGLGTTLMDDLLLGVTDRVVRTVAPPAVCPPVCPAVAGAQGSVIVVIRP